MPHLALAVALSCFSLALTGCGIISTSLGVIGALSTSPSQSSPDSQSASAYRSDVRTATIAAVEAGGAGRDILRNVSSVAAQHGLNDWESAPETYVAIGEGLRKSGIKENDVRSLASQIAGVNQDAIDGILRGFYA